MGEITGRRVFLFTAGAFGVIIAVNLLMAYKAVSTFPGLETANSYVASQSFDARRAAQEALGWSARPSYADGQLTIALRQGAGGLPAPVESFSAQIGRTTERQHDLHPEFTPGQGGFTAPVDLAPGRWEIRIKARATNGAPFEQRLILTVQG